MAAVVPPSATSSGDEHRAEREAQHVDALEHSEDPAEHAWRSRALKRVRPETSKTLRPMLATASSTSASATLGQARDQRDRCARQSAAAISAGAEAAPSDEAERHDDGEQAAGAERGIENAHAGVAHPELVDREHDEEHVHRAEEQRLGGEHADERRGRGARAARSLKPSNGIRRAAELSPLRSAAGRLFVSGQAIQAANSIEHREERDHGARHR